MRRSRPDREPVRNSRDTPAHYPIRAVSKLTGVAIDTLRAWERRYSAVTPIRGAARHAALISPRGLVLRDCNAYQQELVRIGGRGVA